MSPLHVELPSFATDVIHPPTRRPQWAKRRNVTTPVSRLVDTISSAVGADLRQHLLQVGGGLGQTYLLPSTGNYVRINTTGRCDAQGRISMHITRRQHGFFASRADQVYLIAAARSPRVGSTKAQRAVGKRRRGWCVVTIPYTIVQPIVETKLRTSERAALFVRIAGTSTGPRRITLSDGLDLGHREGLQILSPILGPLALLPAGAMSHDRWQAAAYAVLTAGGYECSVPANNIRAIWETGYLQDVGHRDEPRPHNPNAWGSEAPDVTGASPVRDKRTVAEVVVLEVACSMSARNVRVQLEQRHEWCRRRYPGASVKYIVVADQTLCGEVGAILASRSPALSRVTDTWSSDRLMQAYAHLRHRAAVARAQEDRVSCCP